MTQSRLLSVAVVGIFLLAMSAVSMAGDWGGASGSSGPAESGASMDSGSNSPAPEQGSYESRDTVEAGTLPSGERTMSSGSESRSGEDVPTIDAGGLKFREGIDTGP